MIEATLCYLIRPAPVREVLLGLKKTGFGQGKYDGIGGKIEPGETPRQAAVREVGEEIGVRVDVADLVPAGDIQFLFPAEREMEHHVFLFLVWNWSGEPIETDEIRPAWFRVDALPWEEMWADAVHWLPGVLDGGAVRGEIAFNDDNETVAAVRLVPGQAAPDPAP
jgi:mutator protein MutT